MAQFAAYISRGLCNPRLIFPRINGPIMWPLFDVTYGGPDCHNDLASLLGLYFHFTFHFVSFSVYFTFRYNAINLCRLAKK